jgi:hypothetical protein
MDVERFRRFYGFPLLFEATRGFATVSVFYALMEDAIGSFSTGKSN